MNESINISINQTHILIVTTDKLISYISSGPIVTKDRLIIMLYNVTEIIGDNYCLDITQVIHKTCGDTHIQTTPLSWCTSITAPTCNVTRLKRDRQTPEESSRHHR